LFWALSSLIRISCSGAKIAGQRCSVEKLAQLEISVAQQEFLVSE
jgi:hypothetical protein